MSVNHQPQNWRPTSYEQVQRDVVDMVIRETHFLECKSQFDTTAGGRTQLYKALASLANHGGTLVIGVEEDKAQERVVGLSPVEILGQVERIMECASSLDPPLALPDAGTFASPDDAALGIVVLEVPASPMAPHRTPKNGYFSRDSKRAYPMPDAEVELLMRQRKVRTVEVEQSLTDHIVSVQARMSAEENPSPWYAVAVDPEPSHDPFLLRSRLGSGSRKWLEAHMDAANRRIEEFVSVNSEIASNLPINWSPRYNGPVPRRIDGGIRFRSEFQDIPLLVSIIEVMETGAVRLSQNHLDINGTEDIAWTDVLGAAVWCLGLFRSIQLEAGRTVGASAAVQVSGIFGMLPTGRFGTDDERQSRQMAGWPHHSYPAPTYRASRTLNGVELDGDLRDPLDWLLGQFLRNFGVPDFLYGQSS